VVLRTFSPARAWRPAVVTRSARTLGVMNLAEIVSTFDVADETLCIVARRSWTGESDARLVEFTEDTRIPADVLSAGYEYFLGVSTARDEVLSLPLPLSAAQRLVAVIHYAEFDAFPDWLIALARRSAAQHGVQPDRGS
jgi:hypothetical protein